jgi:hypothetical protein
LMSHDKTIFKTVITNNRRKNDSNKTNMAVLLDSIHRISAA